ncbi:MULTISPECIES: glycoside hydrolase family 73 protein [unclassified Clostridium]|uniref:glycoside hydrolase family 73 protein n=1 Tax=unclassified Clostridium TaxID=2614128 RepID=UPI00189A0D5C|nr:MULTISPECIES: glycoside hydrolase family 73 protein [unclassified Clostridium]MBP3915987.1 glycoside hydrolase family 73 protein [Clostridium sp.]MEE0933954.1 glycoside hydrolase family 73 protein [Clostridium sp.]
MKKNIKYNGLGSYTKRNKKIKLEKICVVGIFTILILYIMVLNLRSNIFQEINDLQEVAAVENKEQENIIEENEEDSDNQEVYSNTYMDSEKMEFIETISDGAISNYNKYGILPSITMAQAILESGWGNSELAVTHNNLFGIKADSRWNGAIATIATSENYNDSTIANFRKYDNINESIEDHGKFLYENSRYAEYGLFNGNDYKSQAQALEDAGYSTVKNENGEPIYADKLISLIEKYNLMQYD